jgi:hypothetical protein
MVLYGSLSSVAVKQHRFLPTSLSLLTYLLRGLSPQAKYTDRATSACRRSQCQLLWTEGCHVVSVTDPYGCILGEHFISSLITLLTLHHSRGVQALVTGK